MSTKPILLRALRIALTACAVLAIALVVTQTASACPSCKAALANQEGKGGGDLVAGFFYSIMFMLSMPFAIFGSLSGYFYMLVRRARRQQPSTGSQLPTVPHADGGNVTLSR